MRRRERADEETVTVHVTPRGGLYVNERELLRSKAAQETMAKMEQALGGVEHAATTAAADPRDPSDER